MCVVPNTPKPSRELVHVRLSTDGLKAIDEIAVDEDQTRSATIRLLLKEAIAARRKAKA